jgi:hypothetical protein
MNSQNNEAKSQKIYKVNGEEITIAKLRELIIEAVGDERISSTEIARRINANYKQIVSAIANMVAYRYLNASGCKSHTLYFKDSPCLLQNILRPLPSGYENMTGTVYKETHAKHNLKSGHGAESSNVSSIYSLED